MRLAFVVASFVVAGFVAYHAEPYVRDNSDAIALLANVLTVFAGFLVAIIAVLGDPALVPTGSWRTAEGMRDTLEARLIRHTWLFALYLVGIAILFAGAVMQGAPACEMTQAAKTWITRAYLFVGTAAFALTFLLPSSLMRIQKARMDAEIEKRRGDAHIRSEGQDGDR